MSRFDIHDELTAPVGSAPILKGALSSSGKLNNLVGVLAGSPAALRAYARMRSELRNGTLPAATQERIALAVAEYRGSQYDVAIHAKAARNVGVSLDEIELVRRFRSQDETEQVLLAYIESLLEHRGSVPLHFHEEAREGGWTDEQILEAVAHVALADFSALVTLAGEVPLEGTSREVKPLGKVA
ncbi:MAG: carboxymuconolactone decarboxylase family protein [Solirubrobacterales bacterium]